MAFFGLFWGFWRFVRTFEGGFWGFFGFPENPKKSEFFGKTAYSGFTKGSRGPKKGPKMDPKSRQKEATWK